MTKRALIAICALVLTSATIVAQQSRKSKEHNTFGFSIIGGAAFSQIDGDNYRGYNNIGLYAGLRGITRVSERFEVHIELLYSQKGSKFESRESVNPDGKKTRHVKLDYAEIPVLAAYRVTGSLAKAHVWIEGGISIARLINSDVMDSPEPSGQEFQFSDIEDEFDKTDISVLAGVVVNATSWLGFGLRGTWGIKRFYEHPETVNSNNRETVEFLRNYSLSVFAMYHF